MGGLMTEFASWLWAALGNVLSSIWNFFTDLPIVVLDAVLSAVAGLIEGVSVPAFLSGGLSPLFAQLPSGAQWFLVQFGISNCLGVLAAGLGVRLIRKAVTLFQW